MDNIKTVKALYEAFREKDYDTFLLICTEDLEWIQNDGFPDGQTYKGAAEVVRGVFESNASRWDNFAYHIESFLDAGDTVIVIGEYSGKERTTGKKMKAAAAHVYELRDGKICRFRMFADTKTIWDSTHL